MNHSPQNHARQFTLAAGQRIQALALALPPTDGQWVIHIHNTTGDIAGSPQGVVSVNAIVSGPQATDSIVEFSIGPGEATHFYACGTVTCDILAIGFPATLDIWVEKSNGWIQTPVRRFSNIGAGALAYAPLSLQNGYAPPYRRHFQIYSDVAIDVRMIDENGAICFDVLNLLPANQPLQGFLPPGLRLTAKANAGVANITAAWSTSRG